MSVAYVALKGGSTYNVMGPLYMPFPQGDSGRKADRAAVRADVLSCVRSIYWKNTLYS